ncbi:hypothetical protein DFH06DRAFT_1344966 [Mycena polygramma]|nr:hypothetical protein DFH06DRAFT_1344966 [Mycena polygramma]
MTVSKNHPPSVSPLPIVHDANPTVNGARPGSTAPDTATSSVPPRLSDDDSQKVPPPSFHVLPSTSLGPPTRTAFVRDQNSVRTTCDDGTQNMVLSAGDNSPALTPHDTRLPPPTHTPSAQAVPKERPASALPLPTLFLPDYPGMDVPSRARGHGRRREQGGYCGPTEARWIELVHLALLCSAEHDDDTAPGSEVSHIARARPPCFPLLTTTHPSVITHAPRSRRPHHARLAPRLAPHCAQNPEPVYRRVASLRVRGLDSAVLRLHPAQPPPQGSGLSSKYSSGWIHTPPAQPQEPEISHVQDLRCLSPTPPTSTPTSHPRHTHTLPHARPPRMTPPRRRVLVNAPPTLAPCVHRSACACVHILRAEWPHARAVSPQRPSSPHALALHCGGIAHSPHHHQPSSPSHHVCAGFLRRPTCANVHITLADSPGTVPQLRTTLGHPAATCAKVRTQLTDAVHHEAAARAAFAQVNGATDAHAALRLVNHLARLHPSFAHFLSQSCASTPCTPHRHRAGALLPPWRVRGRVTTASTASKGQHLLCIHCLAHNKERSERRPRDRSDQRRAVFELCRLLHWKKRAARLVQHTGRPDPALALIRACARPPTSFLTGAAYMPPLSHQTPRTPGKRTPSTRYHLRPRAHWSSVAAVWLQL